MLSYYIGQSFLALGGVFVRRFDSGKQLKYTLPILLCIGFLLAPWSLLGTLKDARHISTWTPTECTTVNQTEVVGRGASQSQILQVNYTVNNQIVQGSVQVCDWTSVHNFNRCQQFYPIESSFTCLYNPEDTEKLISLSDTTRKILNSFTVSVELVCVVPVLIAFVLSWQSIRAIAAFFYILFLLFTFPILRKIFGNRIAFKNVDGDENPDNIVAQDASQHHDDHPPENSSEVRVEATPSTIPSVTQVLNFSDDEKMHSEWFLSFKSLWNIAIGNSTAKVAPVNSSKVLTRLFPLDNHHIRQLSEREENNGIVVNGEIQIPNSFHKFCTNAIVEGEEEHIMWVYTPYALHQVFNVDYFLRWLFFYVVVCFIYYSFYTGLLLGVHTKEDAIAITISYCFAFILFLPGMFWELTEPWLTRCCYVMTNKRLARFTQLLYFDIPWRREIVAMQYVRKTAGVFVKPRKWGLYDAQVKCKTTKGWFLFRDLYYKDLSSFRIAIASLTKKKTVTTH